MDKFKIHAVAGILKNPAGEILIALRPSHALQGGLWEFPGGKLEPNETAKQALYREFWEEIGIKIQTADFFSASEQHYEDRIVQLEFWNIYTYDGTAVGKEGQTIEWVLPSALHRRDFLPANREVIASLCMNIIPTAFQAVARRKRSRGAQCTETYMSTEASLQQSHSLKGEG